MIVSKKKMNVKNKQEIKPVLDSLPQISLYCTSKRSSCNDFFKKNDKKVDYFPRRGAFRGIDSLIIFVIFPIFQVRERLMVL